MAFLDVDTLELIKIAKWRIGYYEYFKHSKGEKGKPGEIRGTIESGYTLGRITKNTAFGVYGMLDAPSYISISAKDAI